ncbi:hydrolase [Sporolactobacillus inulinus CASD]|uniref:Hydrolase n=2 Tax=Sporolactobacillus inulinus TaxID=2078 RepID=A0A0U1QLH0_9BACL|nr:isochorismatase family protein [Sporolactobacillus inulinus]KLI01622.1 hydrolase [Sporolactobacillus inulinus CASD]
MKMNKDRTALVVIDLQNGIVNSQHAPYTGAQVVEKTTKLVNTFTKNGAFVALVRVSSFDGKDWFVPQTDSSHSTPGFPDGWDHYVPELDAFQKTYRLTKRQWGAFFGTDLDLQLRRRGIDTLVLCGISTGIGVDTTAREAYARAYQQIFVEDAMTASTKEEHDHCTTHIFPRIGNVRTTDEVLAMLK